METPLEFVVNYLKHIRAISFQIAEYEVLLSSDLELRKAKKGSNVDLSVVRLQTVMLADITAADSADIEQQCKRDNTECGIVSQFVTEQNKEGHLLFADCDTPDLLEVKYDFPDATAIAKTDKGFHIYMREYVDNYQQFLAKITRPCVDPAWLHISGALKGYAVLRFTNNVKKTKPYFI